MKKGACTVLTIVTTLFLISPLPLEARGRNFEFRGGGHLWWAPWASIIGGLAVLESYSARHAPQAVVIREPSLLDAQRATLLSEKVFIYPREGQNEELQAKDRYECHRWAVDQTGYDPTQAQIRDLSDTQSSQKRTEYLRAQGACLDGRGYSMK